MGLTPRLFWMLRGDSLVEFHFCWAEFRENIRVPLATLNSDRCRRIAEKAGIVVRDHFSDTIGTTGIDESFKAK